MKPIKIISYFSDLPGLDYYTKSSYNFLQDCFVHGLEPHVVELESTNDYRKNCLRKPKFILECIEQFKCPVMWIDIDSRIVSNMNELLNSTQEFDIGLCFIGLGNNIRFDAPPKASPIIFNYTESGLSVLKKWVDECQINLDSGGNFFDHEVLVNNVLPSLATQQLKIKILDGSYCVYAHTKENITKHIIMGISAHQHKKEGLRNMGYDDARIRGEVGDI